MTTETKHTPGPWELMEDRAPGGLELGANGRAICEIWRRNNPETEEANARLIAQSPAMALALRLISDGYARIERSGELREFCFSGMRYSMTSDWDWNRLMAVIGWDYALAKAEGKS